MKTPIQIAAAMAAMLQSQMPLGRVNLLNSQVANLYRERNGPTKVRSVDVAGAFGKQVGPTQSRRAKQMCRRIAAAMAY